MDLLRVDGPHSAPSEHYDKYETVMVVGAGIGLTPCASILRAVTKYKWKRGFYPELLHLYWIVPQGELPAFQWFIAYLVDVERELAEDRANGLEHMNHCYVEINIFVTRAKEDFEPPQVKENITTRADRPNPKARQFSAQELMNLLCHPPIKSSNMVQTLKTNPNSANRLQDIFVWDGRPQWDQIFSHQKEQRRYRDIAVCFCGTPIVGADLSKMCKKYSSLDRTGENEVLFHLHKENF
jgi:NADPH oxidase